MEKTIIWITAIILLASLVFGTRLCWEDGEYFQWRPIDDLDTSSAYKECCIDMNIQAKEGYFQCLNPYQCLEQGSSTYEYQCGYGDDTPKYADNPEMTRNTGDPIAGTTIYDEYCSYFSPPEAPNVDTACDLDEISMTYEPRDPCPETGCDFLEEIPDENGTGTIPNPNYCNCVAVDTCGNGIVEEGEECGESGLPNCGYHEICENCVCVDSCGNGKIDDSEMCDPTPSEDNLDPDAPCGGGICSKDCVCEAAGQNNPPTISGNNLGPIYGDSSQGFTIYESTTTPEKGQKYKAFLSGFSNINNVENKITVTDDYSSSLSYYVGGIPGLNYKPNPPVPDEELPKEDSFKLKAEDDGTTSIGSIEEKESDEQTVNCVLCPKGLVGNKQFKHGYDGKIYGYLGPVPIEASYARKNIEFEININPKSDNVCIIDKFIIEIHSKPIQVIKTKEAGMRQALYYKIISTEDMLLRMSSDKQDFVSKICKLGPNTFPKQAEYDAIQAKIRKNYPKEKGNFDWKLDLLNDKPEYKALLQKYPNCELWEPSYKIVKKGWGYYYDIDWGDDFAVDFYMYENALGNIDISFTFIPNENDKQGKGKMKWVISDITDQGKTLRKGSKGEFIIDKDIFDLKALYYFYKDDPVGAISSKIGGGPGHNLWLYTRESNYQKLIYEESIGKEKVDNIFKLFENCCPNYKETIKKAKTRLGVLQYNSQDWLANKNNFEEFSGWIREWAIS